LHSRQNPQIAVSGVTSYPLKYRHDIGINALQHLGKANFIEGQRTCHVRFLVAHPRGARILLVYASSSDAVPFR
jgi:hypothetical protein